MDRRMWKMFSMLNFNPHKCENQFYCLCTCDANVLVRKMFAFDGRGNAVESQWHIKSLHVENLMNFVRQEWREESFKHSYFVNKLLIKLNNNKNESEIYRQTWNCYEARIWYFFKRKREKERWKIYNIKQEDNLLLCVVFFSVLLIKY